MSLDATIHARTRIRTRPAAWLIAAAALAALALVLHGPIPQWAAYHQFADARPLWGIPNAADVLSNLPFAAIGLWGLVRSGRIVGAARSAWRGFMVALIATALGSATYHWAPDDSSLVLDRLPIAVACALLCCAFLAERVDARWAAAPTLGVATIAAVASVALWWWTESHGAGDLRAYLFVQFLPMLLVPTGLLLGLGHGRRGIVAAPAWWAVLVAYAAAKAFELGDHAVLEATGVVAGHTLKHLLAAGGAALLLNAAISSGSRR